MDRTEPASLEVQHRATPTRGAFVIERDGRRLAGMTYVRAGAKRAIIEHTAVDDALRGEGAGSPLLQTVVEGGLLSEDRQPLGGQR